MNIRPTIKQALVWEKLFDEETNYILFGGASGGGKSWLLCEWLLYMSLQYPNTKWFIGREELKRLMSSTYITFLKVMQHHKIPKTAWNYDGKYNFIQFINGSRIDLLDVKELPSDPLYERFGSTEFTGGALEEVGEVAFGAFDTLKSRIGRHMNKEYSIPPKILLTCNPKKNWVYNEFYKPWKEKKITQDKCFIQSLYKDNPHTAKEYEKLLMSIQDKTTRERLMHGLWEYDDTQNNLMQYENILNIFTNAPKRTGTKYLSCDVARYGSDKIEYFIWDGLHIEQIITKEKQGTDKTAADIRELQKIHSIPLHNVVIDDDGVGGGVTDHLRGCKAFVNGSKAIEVHGDKQNYQNLKTQCAYTLAKLINSGAISCYKEIPIKTKEDLIQELEQVKRDKIDDDTAPLAIIKKDDVKSNIGRSPDLFDAMNMRMIYELRPLPLERVYSKESTRDRVFSKKRTDGVFKWGQ